MVSLVVKLCGEERRKVARDQMKRKMNVPGRKVRLATTLENGSSSLLHVDERGLGRRAEETVDANRRDTRRVDRTAQIETTATQKIQIYRPCHTKYSNSLFLPVKLSITTFL